MGLGGSYGRTRLCRRSPPSPPPPGDVIVTRRMVISHHYSFSGQSRQSRELFIFTTSFRTQTAPTLKPESSPDINFTKHAVSPVRLSSNDNIINGGRKKPEKDEKSFGGRMWCLKLRYRYGSRGRMKRRTAAAAAVDVPPPWVVMADDDAKHAHACAQNTSVDAGHGGWRCRRRP